MAKHFRAIHTRGPAKLERTNHHENTQPRSDLHHPSTHQSSRHRSSTMSLATLGVRSNSRCSLGGPALRTQNFRPTAGKAVRSARTFTALSCALGCCAVPPADTAAGPKPRECPSARSCRTPAPMFAPPGAFHDGKPNAPPNSTRFPAAPINNCCSSDTHPAPAATSSDPAPDHSRFCAWAVPTARNWHRDDASNPLHRRSLLPACSAQFPDHSPTDP